MQRSTLFGFAAAAALGLAAVAVPVIAQQAPRPGGAMMGMMGGGMMGGMMGAAQSYAMANFDTNKDGKLSPAEMAAGIQSEIKTYDADANGTLSLDEFAALHAAHTRPMTVRVFQMHDADGDAQVTEAEMATMATMMQSHMARLQGGMPGMDQGMMGDN